MSYSKKSFKTIKKQNSEANWVSTNPVTKYKKLKRVNTQKYNVTIYPEFETFSTVGNTVKSSFGVFNV